jgi:hypothetical protein
MPEQGSSTLAEHRGSVMSQWTLAVDCEAEGCDPVHSDNGKFTRKWDQLPPVSTINGHAAKLMKRQVIYGDWVAQPLSTDRGSSVMCIYCRAWQTHRVCAECFELNHYSYCTLEPLHDGPCASARSTEVTDALLDAESRSDIDYWLRSTGYEGMPRSEGVSALARQVLELRAKNRTTEANDV